MSDETPGTRRADQKAATRRAILEGAIATFADLGFEGTAIRDVSERCGVQQSLIVYHFENKEKLWQAAVETVWTRLEERIAARFGGTERGLPDALAPGSASPDVVRTFLRALLAAIAQEPAYVRIALHEAGRDSARFRWLAKRHLDAHFAGGLEVMELAKQARLLPQGASPAHMVYVLAGAALGPFALAADVRRNLGVDPTDPAFVETYAETLTALLVR